MPMSPSALRVSPSMRRTLRTRSGPVNSRPRKKLRATLMSGTRARSWYTVSMPNSRASRGDSMRTSRPRK